MLAGTAAAELAEWVATGADGEWSVDLGAGLEIAESDHLWFLLLFGFYPLKVSGYL